MAHGPNRQKETGKNNRIYEFSFTPDTRPFERQIDELKHQIIREKDEKKLFDDEVTKEVERLENNIALQEEEKRNMIESFSEIVFTGSVEQVKFKPAATEMVVGFPDEVVELLNKHRFDLVEYKLDLRPLKL